jgi:transposase, IS5 family
MRMKIDQEPTFPLLLDDGELKIVSDYRMQYDTISTILDMNSAILDAVHNDLKDWGSDNGRDSTYSSEHLFRALLVKWIEGLSFRDTIVRLADSTILRNFTRINSGKVMNFTVLDTAFKHISASTWNKINALLEQWAKKEKYVTGKDLRLDSTVCESNIHYPTDAHLLWDVYRVAARIMQQIGKEDPTQILGHRFHASKIKRLYTFIATHGTKKRKSTIRKIEKTKRLLLQRVAAIVATAQNVVNYGKQNAGGIMTIARLMQLENYLADMQHVVDQSRRAFNGETVPASERIFSIFEPHTEILMRGKEHKPFEFGHLVQLGQTREKFICFYAVEELSRHDTEMVDPILEHHKKSFGSYPETFATDKNYYKSMDHIAKWEKKINVFSMCKKGSRTEDEVAREHSTFFKLAQKFRAGCEGSISVLKRVFGLRRCQNRGFNSFAAALGCLVLCHNLVVLSRL